MIGRDLTPFGLRTQETIVDPGPWSVGPRIVRNVICPDGSQRSAYLSPLGADTFFSIPARVYVRGLTVAGYVTSETLEGFSVETVGDPSVWKFVPYTYRKNGNAFGERERPAYRHPVPRIGFSAEVPLSQISAEIVSCSQEIRESDPCKR